MKKILISLLVAVSMLAGCGKASAKQNSSFKVTNHNHVVKVVNTSKRTHAYNVKAKWGKKYAAFNLQLKPGQKATLVGGKAESAVLVGKEFKHVKLTVAQFTKKQARHYSHTGRVCKDKTAKTVTVKR